MHLFATILLAASVATFVTLQVADWLK